MFDLVCDPMGVVVDTCLNELVPALVMWNKHEKQPLTQLYQGVLSRLLSSAQVQPEPQTQPFVHLDFCETETILPKCASSCTKCSYHVCSLSIEYLAIIFLLPFLNWWLEKLCVWQRCPPLSGVEGTAEAHLRSLGERERWNIDVLLRMLSQLLPEVRNYAFETCPYPDKVVDTDLGTDASFFTEDIINCYCRYVFFFPFPMPCVSILFDYALQFSTSVYEVFNPVFAVFNQGWICFVQVRCGLASLGLAHAGLLCNTAPTCSYASTERRKPSHPPL